jgi:hypothetical protein
MLPYLIAGAIGFGIGKLFEEGGETFGRGGMTNEDILRSFLTSERETQTNNLATFYSTLGNVMLLRNYGTLIAKRMGRRVEITNVKYSKTTSAITNRLKALAEEMGYNVSYVSEFEEGGETFRRGGRTPKKVIKVRARGGYSLEDFFPLFEVYKEVVSYKKVGKLELQQIIGKKDVSDEFEFKTEADRDYWFEILNKEQEKYFTVQNKKKYVKYVLDNFGNYSEEAEDNGLKTLSEKLHYFADDLDYDLRLNTTREDFIYYLDLDVKDKYTGGGETNLLSDKFTEAGYDTYARNFGVAQIGGFNDEKDINILVSANLLDMYEATGEEEFEDKPFVLILETHAYPEFWSDEYAEKIKDMVGDDTINPRTIDYLSDAHSYGLGVPLSTYADDMRFKTEEQAIKFLNSKKLNDQISGLGMLSGFHFDKQINRIGDTGWKYLSEQVGANYDEYAGGGEAKKRKRRANEQIGKTDRSVDKTRVAKPVGYRFTNSLASKLRKDQYAVPTEKQITKYLGKGIYKENRKNKSDRDRTAKL